MVIGAVFGKLFSLGFRKDIEVVMIFRWNLLSESVRDNAEVPSLFAVGAIERNGGWAEDAEPLQQLLVRRIVLRDIGVQQHRV